MWMGGPLRRDRCREARVRRDHRGVRGGARAFREARQGHRCRGRPPTQSLLELRNLDGAWKVQALTAQYTADAQRVVDLDKEETSLSLDLVKLRQKIKFENESAEEKVVTDKQVVVDEA